jgi:hypothetical protein
MTEGRGERATGTPDITIHDPEDAIGIVSGGGSGERATGVPNTIYDLSSVLFHSLEGGASYDTYIQDAEREGDEELTEFFRRVREEDRDRAAEARIAARRAGPRRLTRRRSGFWSLLKARAIHRDAGHGGGSGGCSIGGCTWG